MKKITLFLLSVFSATLLMGQSNILFNDDFNDNKNNWDVGVSADKTTSVLIENGKLKVTAPRVWDYTQPVMIDQRKDFVMELEFSFKKKDTPSMVMLLTKNDSYRAREIVAFSVHSSGQGAVISIADDVTDALKKYTALNREATTPPSSYTIKVEVKNNTTSMYVNGKYFYFSDKMIIPGNEIGLACQGAGIEIERLTVFQQNTGINLPKDLNPDIKKKLISNNVNSVENGIGILIAPDGKTLYMDVRAIEDKKNPDAYGCDDILYSTRKADGEWDVMRPMPAPITSPTNNDIISVSADNNTIFMADTTCYPSNQVYLYKSNRTQNGWGPIQRMSIKDGYNKSVYCTIVLAPDGKHIILSLRIDGTKGSSDMYVCSRLNDSTWSSPVSIGKTLNSMGTDIPSFIAADNKTFYYASDGKPGYGNVDLFVTRRLDDTWTNWSEPENLGPGINGKGWDAYYRMSAKGDYAYYSTDDNGKLMHSKFFTVEIPKEIKPDPVVMVKGKVINSKTQTPVAAQIYYEILPEGKEAGVARSNPSTGEYNIILPYGKQYGYRAEVKGFITVNENLELAEEKEYIEIERDLYLVPIEVGQTIKLNNVFFVQSKSELLPSSYPELDRLAQILKDNPHLEIEIRGYTDNIGDPVKNLKLSEDRVNVVRAYLINRGIPGKQITGKGFGGENAVASNETEETRKLNRRVEFVIIHK